MHMMIKCFELVLVRLQFHNSCVRFLISDADRKNVAIIVHGTVALFIEQPSSFFPNFTHIITVCRSHF
jgi:hypothetical protein